MQNHYEQLVSQSCIDAEAHKQGIQDLWAKNAGSHRHAEADSRMQESL